MLELPCAPDTCRSVCQQDTFRMWNGTNAHERSRTVPSARQVQAAPQSPRTAGGVAMALSNGVVYMDHAATTPTDPDVLARMLPYFTEHFGNPSSIYTLGRDSA